MGRPSVSFTSFAGVVEREKPSNTRASEGKHEQAGRFSSWASRGGGERERERSDLAKPTAPSPQQLSGLTKPALLLPHLASGQRTLTPRCSAWACSTRSPARTSPHTGRAHHAGARYLTNPPRVIGSGRTGFHGIIAQRAPFMEGALRPRVMKNKSSASEMHPASICPGSGET